MIALAQDYSFHPEKYDTDALAETMQVIAIQAQSIKKFLDSYYSLTHLPEPRKQSMDAREFIYRLRTLVALEEKQRGFVSSVCNYHVPQNMTLSIDRIS